MLSEVVKVPYVEKTPKKWTPRPFQTMEDATMETEADQKNSVRQRFGKGGAAFLVAIGLLIVGLTIERIIEVRQQQAQAPQPPAVKDWRPYELKGTDVRIDLPGEPKDLTQPLPAAAKSVFFETHSFIFQDKDLTILVNEMSPTDQKGWLIKDLGDAGMKSFKRQIPSLTYEFDVKSDNRGQYEGSFVQNGKSFSLKGCGIIKAEKPRRLWVVVSTFPKDESASSIVAQRALDSVIFTGSAERCK